MPSTRPFARRLNARRTLRLPRRAVKRLAPVTRTSAWPSEIRSARVGTVLILTRASAAGAATSRTMRVRAKRGIAPITTPGPPNLPLAG